MINDTNIAQNPITGLPTQREIAQTILDALGHSRSIQDPAKLIMDIPNNNTLLINFLTHALAHSMISNEAFYIAIVLIAKIFQHLDNPNELNLFKKNIAQLRKKPETLDNIDVIVPIIGCLLAVKVLEDEHFNNRSFWIISGLSLSLSLREFNLYEFQTLQLLEHDLNVSLAVFESAQQLVYEATRDPAPDPEPDPEPVLPLPSPTMTNNTDIQASDSPVVPLNNIEIQVSAFSPAPAFYIEIPDSNVETIASHHTTPSHTASPYLSTFSNVFTPSSNARARPIMSPKQT